MWFFTTHGFFSVVCARQGDGRHGNPVDPARVMVRARVRQHLEAIRARFPEQLGACDIEASSSTDYAYRLFVDKAAWTRVAAALADDIDYDNFKGAVARVHGSHDAYEHALHDVWSVMHRLQRRREAG